MLVGGSLHTDGRAVTLPIFSIDLPISILDDLCYTEFTVLNSLDVYQDGGLTSTDSVLTKSAHAYAALIEAGMLATHSASNHSTYNRRNQLPESTCKVLEQLHITQSTRPVTVPP